MRLPYKYHWDTQSAIALAALNESMFCKPCIQLYSLLSLTGNTWHCSHDSHASPLDSKALQVSIPATSHRCSTYLAGQADGAPVMAADAVRYKTDL